jgi:hypothetical protein
VRRNPYPRVAELDGLGEQEEHGDDEVAARGGSGGGVLRIVVRVDGSPSSQAALRWAVRQAMLTCGTVDAVIAWQTPMVFRNYGWAPIYVEEAGD